MQNEEHNKRRDRVSPKRITNIARDKFTQHMEGLKVERI